MIFVVTDTARACWEGVVLITVRGTSGSNGFEQLSVKIKLHVAMVSMVYREAIMIVLIMESGGMIVNINRRDTTNYN